MAVSSGAMTEYEYVHEYSVISCPQHLALLLHKELGRRCTAIAREMVCWTTHTYISKNIHYDLDLYGADLPKGTPALIFLHGGYWQDFDKDISGYVAPLFVKKNIKVIVPSFLKTPRAKLTDIMDQIVDLGIYILNNAHKLGFRSVWLCGHGSGAHLAANLLYNIRFYNRLSTKGENVFKGLILMSGIYDLKPILNTTINRCLLLSRRESIRLDYSDMLVSEFLMAHRDDIKVIFAVGENESMSVKLQSSALEHNLHHMGVKTAFHYLLGKDFYQVVESLRIERSYPFTISIINEIRSS